MSKQLTREQQELKLDATSLFSDLTSVRNPDRIKFMEEFLAAHKDKTENKKP